MKRMHPTSDLVPSQGYAESQVVRPGLKTILPQVGSHHGQGVTPLFVQHTDVNLQKLFILLFEMFKTFIPLGFSYTPTYGSLREITLWRNE